MAPPGRAGMPLRVNLLLFYGNELDMNEIVESGNFPLPDEAILGLEVGTSPNPNANPNYAGLFASME